MSRIQTDPETGKSTSYLGLVLYLQDQIVAIVEDVISPLLFLIQEDLKLVNVLLRLIPSDLSDQPVLGVISDPVGI